MRELMTYLNYLTKIPVVLKAQPILLTSVIGIMALDNQTLAIVLLIGFVIADFGTGVLASWTNARKIKQKDWFKSEEWRKSVIKSVSYALLVLSCYGIEKIFLIKKFKFGSYTDLDFTITLIATALCIAIEFYSIFWENLPQAGIDIPGYFKKIVKALKSTISEVKSVKNDSNSPE